jgi:hypothetical protein
MKILVWTKLLDSDPGPHWNQCLSTAMVSEYLFTLDSLSSHPAKCVKKWPTVFCLPVCADVQSDRVLSFSPVVGLAELGLPHHLTCRGRVCSPFLWFKGGEGVQTRLRERRWGQIQTLLYSRYLRYLCTLCADDLRENRCRSEMTHGCLCTWDPHFWEKQ